MGAPEGASFRAGRGDDAKRERDGGRKGQSRRAYATDCKAHSTRFPQGFPGDVASGRAVFRRRKWMASAIRVPVTLSKAVPAGRSVAMPVILSPGHRP